MPRVFPSYKCSAFLTIRRGQLKCDGTRAETRFRLSAKRTGPFKSAGVSVQSTNGSRGVRISGSNAGYTMFRGSVKGTGYTHSIRQFPLHFPSRASPCAITFQLDSSNILTLPIILGSIYSSVSQPLWDRGLVNSFFIRRGPGTNKFTRKYLSNFLSSYINLTWVLIINYGIIIKRISTLMYTVWNVDKYKITFKLVINHWSNEILIAE